MNNAEKTRHTPGPWFVDGATIYRAIGDNLFPNRFPIVDLYDWNEDANAALIAAAPDLLAALKAIVNFMADDLDVTEIIVTEQARTAIARAEGWL